MNNNLSCNTIKDLLPIYFDGIASEETNICVKKHLSECEYCQSEYKKLYEFTKEDEQIIKNEATHIKTLRKKIIRGFITVIVFGILLISINILSQPSELARSHSIFEIISVLSLYVGMYILPPLGIFIAIIYKNTIPGKEKNFWPNVTISFLGIWLLIEVVFLLWRFLLVIKEFL